MLRHLLIGILIGLLASAGGCTAPGLVVRSERGLAPVEFQRVRPVEYAKEDLHHAVERYAEQLAAAIRRRDGQLRLSLASAPGAPAHPQQLAALVEPYLEWCARRGAPGDCLEVLDARTPGLSTNAKRTIALRMSLASGLQEAAEVVRNIDPVRVEATLVIWFTVYLATLVFPDATVTKALFVVMTANLIAFLGVDGFRNIIQGYRAMAAEADVAETFDQLREAGERYGRRMGPSMLRIVTALVTWGVGAATGMARPVTSLPGGAQAVANAQAQGFNLAAVSGGSVTVSASGTVTLVLAAQATAEASGTGSSQQSPASQTAGAPRKVGDRLESVEDVFANPRLLSGKRPADLLSRLFGGVPKGWRVDVLGKGSQAGKGFILREYSETGTATGRIIQWHPGGGHHGPSPYWKVSSPATGTVRVGPQFE